MLFGVMARGLWGDYEKRLCEAYVPPTDRRDLAYQALRQQERAHHESLQHVPPLQGGPSSSSTGVAQRAPHTAKEVAALQEKRRRETEARAEKLYRQSLFGTAPEDTRRKTGPLPDPVPKLSNKDRFLAIRQIYGRGPRW